MTDQGSGVLLRFAPIHRCTGCATRMRGDRLWCADCTPPPAETGSLIRLIFRCERCGEPVAWWRRGARHVAVDKTTNELSVRTGIGHRPRVARLLEGRPYARKRAS